MPRVILEAFNFKYLDVNDITKRISNRRGYMGRSVSPNGLGESKGLIIMEFKSTFSSLEMWWNKLLMAPKYVIPPQNSCGIQRILALEDLGGKRFKALKTFNLGKVFLTKEPDYDRKT